MFSKTDKIPLVLVAQLLKVYWHQLSLHSPQQLLQLQLSQWHLQELIWILTPLLNQLFTYTMAIQKLLPHYKSKAQLHQLLQPQLLWAFQELVLEFIDLSLFIQLEKLISQIQTHLLTAFQVLQQQIFCLLIMEEKF